MATTAQDAKAPPYIPWKTFDGYITSLKSTTIPHTLDNTVKPHSMAGGLWRQLISALQFLSLIGINRTVTPALKRLVDSHGTPEFASAMREEVFPIYAEIIRDLPLENATLGQLKKRFEDNGEVKGQIVEKSVRFFIHVLKSAGIEHSTHFATRISSGAPRKSARKGAVNRSKAAEVESEEGGKFRVKPPPPIDPAMIDFPIPMGDKTGFIRVRADITMEQYPLVEAMLNAVKVLAQTNSGATN